MLQKTREDRIIEQKNREWKKQADVVDRYIRSKGKSFEDFWKTIMKHYKSALNWFMFYKPEDKNDRKAHVWEVFFVWAGITYIALNLFGLI